MLGTSNYVNYWRRNPKRSAKYVLSYWSIGIVNCTWKHFFAEAAVIRKFVKHTMDLLSVREYVIKKGRAHGHRYGEKPRDKEYYLANQLMKCKKIQFQGFMTDSYEIMTSEFE